MTDNKIQMTVNGKSHQLMTETLTTLLNALREDLGLTGLDEH